LSDQFLDRFVSEQGIVGQMEKVFRAQLDHAPVCMMDACAQGLERACRCKDREEINLPRFNLFIDPLCELFGKTPDIFLCGVVLGRKGVACHPGERAGSAVLSLGRGEFELVDYIEVHMAGGRA